MPITVIYKAAERKKPYAISDDGGTSRQLKPSQLLRQLENYPRGIGISFGGDPLPPNMESQIIDHLRHAYVDRPRIDRSRQKKKQNKKSPKRRRYN